MASKIGPDLESHSKIRHAWALHHSSLGLHLLGLSFAQRTGGFVSVAFVTEKIPAKRERTAALEALTSVAPGEENPMWSPVDGGWQIHNFAKHVDFRGEGLSEARSAAGRKGAASRWQDGGNSHGNLPSGLPSVAISDKERTTTAYKAEVLSLCDRLAIAMQRNDPKAHVAPRSERWLKAGRLLLDQDGRTVEEVERVIDWCQTDSFWRSNILSMPKLREKFPQLLLRMTPAVKSERAWRGLGEANLARNLEGAA